jgi:hypothetical protein
VPIREFEIGKEYTWEESLELLGLPLSPYLKRAVVRFSGGRFALFLTSNHRTYSNWIRDAVLSMEIEPGAASINKDLRGLAAKYLFFRDEPSSADGPAPFRFEGEVAYMEDLRGKPRMMKFRVLGRQP